MAPCNSTKPAAPAAKLTLQTGATGASLAEQEACFGSTVNRTEPLHKLQPGGAERERDDEEAQVQSHPGLGAGSSLLPTCVDK